MRQIVLAPDDLTDFMQSKNMKTSNVFYSLLLHFGRHKPFPRLLKDSSACQEPERIHKGPAIKS